jgi:polyisoprenoid-binding protein YceI
MFRTLVSHTTVGWLKGEMDQRKGEINNDEEERKKDSNTMTVTAERIDLDDWKIC